MDPLKPSKAMVEAAMANIQSAMADFVQIELELALTFCEVAATSGNETTIRRNRELAREAYESAQRFATRLDVESLDPFALERIRKAIAQLDHATDEPPGTLAA
jgi:hypothetical protein